MFQLAPTGPASARRQSSSSHDRPLGFVWALLVVAALLSGAHAADDTPLPFFPTDKQVQYSDGQKKLAEAGAAALVAGDLKAAQSLFIKLCQAAPNHPLAHANLGTVEFQLMNHSAAIKSLERALTLDRTLTDSWLTLSMAYLRIGHNDRALAAAANALANAPDNAKAHQYMALVLSTKGWVDAAESELRTATKLAPNDATTHFNLCVLYLEKSPPANALARRHYQQAIALGANADPEIDAYFAELDASDK